MRDFFLLLIFATFSHIGSAQGSLELNPPEDWIKEESASPMRVAQFILPKAEGDSEDASLIVFYFGGAGGSIDANLERWIDQMDQPDGRPSQEVAISETFDVNDLPMVVLDLPGTYVAPVRPNSNIRYNKPGFHLKAAVIETPVGPYFFKLVGPALTVARWNDSVTSFLEDIHFR